MQLSFHRRFRPAAVFTFLSLFLGLAFHNCGRPMQVTSTPTNHPSPFQSPTMSREGIILTPGLVKSLTGGATTMNKLGNNTIIPASTKLGFVLDDACISDRYSSALDRYFLDPYLNKTLQAELTPNQKFNQSLLLISLPVDISFDQLVQIKRSDSCIMGIANDQGLQYKIAQSVGSTDHFSKQTYLNQIQFDKTFFDANTNPQSVTVAVIDSGYDLTKGPSFNLIDPTFMVGTDYVRGDNVPEDELGHGTMVGSLIGALGGGTSFHGAAGSVTKILPIKGIDSAGKISTESLFQAMKHAVNAGADVMNLSLGVMVGVDPAQRTVGMDISCDPIFGASLFEVIENGVFVVMAAGNGTHTDSGGNPVPGPIFSPKENSAENLFDYNVAPACWARYYKGALAVASTDGSGAIASHSNWGDDAVEMAAPGENLYVPVLNGNFSYQSGTSLAAPLVTAAVADTIGYFKKRGWFYNPWIIEDTLINGSPTAPQLWGSAIKKVRLGKNLNFKTLSDYLVSLNSKTDEERRQQPSDNPEAGFGLNRGLASVNRQPIKLEVYTKEMFVNVKAQSQVQAVIYYDDATTLVVSDAAQWSSADPNLKISSTGMAYPQTAGNYQVTAKYLGLTGSATIQAVNFSTLTGSNGVLKELKVVHGYNFPNNDMGISGCSDCRLYATYTDGRYRQVQNYTRILTRTLKSGQVVTQNYSPPTSDSEPFYIGGANITISFLYNGIRLDYPWYVPKFTVQTQVAKSNTDFFLKGYGLPDNSVFSVQADNFVGCVHQSVDEFGKINSRSILVLNTYPRDCNVPDGSCLPVKKWMTQKINYKSGSGVSLGRVSENIIPLDNNTTTLTYNCEFTHWGDGNLNKLVLSKDFQIQNPKPVSLTFSGSGGGFFNPITSLSITAGAPVEQVIVGTYIIYDNGQSLNISGRANYQILNSKGSSSPLNWVEQYSSLAFARIFDGQKGEVMTVMATDPVTGLSNSLKVTMPNIPFPQPPALTPVNVQIQGMLPAKTDSSYCVAHGNDSPFAGGDGSNANPYIICSVQQLIKSTLLASYRLEANLDLSQINLNSIPIKLNIVPGGYFDGNGFTISNLITADATNDQFIFDIQSNFGSQQFFKNVNFKNISIRGAKAALIQHSMWNNLSIENIHADQIYIEGNSVSNVFTDGALKNSSFTSVQFKSNPSFTKYIVGAGMGTGENVYIEFSALGAPGSLIQGAVATGQILNSYVKATVRSGVSSQITGASGSPLVGSKIEMDVNAPGGYFQAMIGGCRTSDFIYDSRDLGKTPYFGILNSEFSGNILLGSDTTGGTYTSVGPCLSDGSIAKVSGLKVNANVNARIISGLATSDPLAPLKFPYFANSDVKLILNNVPVGSEVSRYFGNRKGFRNYPIFTYVNNVNVNLTWPEGNNTAPDIYKDANGQPSQTIQSLIPVGWEN